MSFRDNKRLFDIATRLQIYIEGVKAQQTAEFHATLLLVDFEFRKLLDRIRYATLDGLTKAELNALVISLRKSQAQVYSRYTGKILDQLQEFMQATLKLNRIAYASAMLGFQQDEDEAPVVLGDQAASNFIAEENDSNAFIALFGIGAIKRGSNTLWPKITALPIAANGVLPIPFLRAFSISAQAGVENILRKSYSNKWSIKETKDELTKQLERINVQEGAVSSTIMQHVASAVSAAVTSALFAKYRWVSVLDNATTDICLERSGKVYRFGEGPLPPAHIRCRSIVVPIRP